MAHLELVMAVASMVVLLPAVVGEWRKNVKLDRWEAEHPV